jgi:hypothetical protein
LLIRSISAPDSKKWMAPENSTKISGNATVAEVEEHASSQEMSGKGGVNISL